MALPLTPEQRLQAENKAWGELKECDGKDTAPNDLNGLHNWVQLIAGCLKAKTDGSDKIGIDPYTNGYKLRDYFGPLKDGQLMNAEGTNNDCLIHSFLTCVCPDFRTYDVVVRRQIARYFRRFIATQLVNNDLKALLNSSSFLPSDLLDILSKKYKTPIILVMDSDYPVDRLFIINPNPNIDPKKENFWIGDRKSNTQIYYVIHGSGAHFTPVAWTPPKVNNDKYKITDIPYDNLFFISGRIEKDMFDDILINNIRIAETIREMNTFLDTDPTIQKIKKDFPISSTQQDKIAYIHNNMRQISNLLHTKIAGLNTEQYRRDYAYAHEMDYIRALMIGGVIPQEPESKPKSKPEPVFTTGGTDLAAAIEASEKTYEEEKLKKSHDSAIQIAILESIITAQKEDLKRKTHNIRLLSSIPLEIQKTVEASAKIGNQPATEYTVHVGNGVFVEPTVLGGKRRTKKMKLSKRKTKKLKK